MAHVSYRRGVQRYTSSDEDSARWETFPFRSGDIVVSTRSKSGTTWVQMICALLVHGPDLPAPLGELSPWLDHAVAPLDRVVGRLEGQPYRRIIKTHTPLDGVPIDPRATYLVVGRHPLDLAVSLYHQGDNIDRERVAELTGVPVRRATRPVLHEWLVEWMRDETTPQERMDSLVGVVHHAADAWSRAESTDNVTLLHYADLRADLDGEMRRVADVLGVTVAEDRWPALVAAAGFDRMRDRAETVVPNAGGVLKDPARFFRSGGTGEGVATLSDDELAAYQARVATMARPEVVAWLHEGTARG